jgi:long-chain acyl-CoA synthetase
MCAAQSLGGVPVPSTRIRSRGAAYSSRHAGARFALADNQEQSTSLEIQKKVPSLETLIVDEDPRGLRT